MNLMVLDYAVCRKVEPTADIVQNAMPVYQANFVMLGCFNRQQHASLCHTVHNISIVIHS